VTTSEQQHRRSPHDEPHVRRICALRPELETGLGLADHADALPAVGPEARAAVLEANLAWRRELEAQATTSRDRLLDARVFSASLELHRFVEDEIAAWRHDPDEVSPLADVLLQQLRGPLPVDDEQRFAALSSRLRSLRSWLAQARSSATSTDVFSPSTELTIRARDVLDGMPELLRAIADAAHGAAPSSSTRQPSPARLPGALVDEVDAAVDDAGGALDEHRDWLTSLATRPHVPLGVERYDEILRLRGLDLTASEVLDLGRSVAEEMRVEITRVLRRGFKGLSLEAALASARKNAPLNLPEAVAWTRELVQQSRAFLLENAAIPLPSPDEDLDELLVDAMPATLSPSGQAAAYLPPPPLAPRQQGMLLVREPPGSQADGLKELSVADLESLVASLAFPGRHAQAMWQNRTTTLARRGAMVGGVVGAGAAWGLDMLHGWGLVAAELMRELAFRHSPASRLLMVRQALTAALVAVADVDLAIGRMTPEETASFLVRRAGMRLPVARAVVRTLLKAPTTGLSGLVGKVRIEQLRREAHKRWRTGYSDKRFHALLLVNGPIPLAYLFERLDEPQTYVTDVITAANRS
jgi:uncharacterized protein (DUF885 family)